MAFTNRSKREMLRPPATATDPAVGPGSYSSPPQAPPPQRAAYAPFASTAPRAVQLEPVDYTPGPGEYDARLCERRQPAARTVFMSTTARTQTIDTGVPGPGSYAGPSSWSARSRPPLRKQDLPEGGVQWQRVTSAPSIPAGPQTYGYKETSGGDLIAQPPPFKGHTGTHTDTAGPGAYGPDWSKGMKTQTRSVVEFGRSRTQRQFGPPTSAGKAEGVPGPGQYEPALPKGTTRGAKKQSSIFASRVAKGLPPAVSDTPGPGHYSHAEAFEHKQEPARRAFGSGTTRASGAYVQDAADTPGPGDYALPSSFARTDAKSADAVRDQARRRAPFASTSDRFPTGAAAASLSYAAIAASGVPGPGSYRPVTLMADELKKKIISRPQPFGATASRFKEAKRLPVPGPGAYDTVDPNRATFRELKTNDDSAVVTTRNSRPSGVFVSTSRRFSEPARPASGHTGASAAPSRPTQPAPGSYSPHMYKHPRPSEQLPSSVFASRAERGSPMTRKANMEHLGPGSYDAQPSPRATPGAESSFRSGQNRFSLLRDKVVTPGPGTYEGSKPLIKRSFNVTF